MKKGHFDSKTGGNAFQKTESESWGLPLMNGGLKSCVIRNLFNILQQRTQCLFSTLNQNHVSREVLVTVRLCNTVLVLTESYTELIAVLEVCR